MADPTTLRVLQITDVHLTGAADGRLLGVRTQASLEAVLTAALAQHRPAAVLATGDIAHDPQPGVYRRFHDTLRASVDAPMLCVPGNHDLLAPMRDAGLPMADLDLDGWCVLGLDSHADDHVEAVLPQARREALVARAETAVAGGRHVLVATHHPPLALDCPWLDVHRIPDAQALLDGLAGTARGLVFGHAHQAVDARHGTLALLGTPATCFQFAPRSPRFELDATAPGWRWLTLGADGSIGSSVHRIDPALVDRPDPAQIRRAG